VANASLTVVGVGHGLAGHVTAEVGKYLESADRLLYLVNHSLTERFLKTVNSNATSLAQYLREGRSASDLIERVVEAMVSPLRKGLNVCAAFSGHPAILVPPAHIAIRRAQSEGFPAQMLPGVSAPDCLFAQLSVDPAAYGCAVFDATDFLIHSRVFDPASSLILLQIGSIGVTTYSTRNIHRQSRLQILEKYLRKELPASHEVVIYEAAVSPIAKSTIEVIRLGGLHEHPVTAASTLYVPPCRRVAVSKQMLKRIGMAAIHVERGRR